MRVLSPLSLARRLLIVAVIVAASVFFGRDVIASALVARADAVMYTPAGASGARTYVDRARIFDPTYPPAAQRLAKLALQTKTPADVAAALPVVAAALERSPHDEYLHMGYAQLLFADHNYRDAATSWASLSDEYPATPLYRGWAAEAARYAGACDLAIRYFGQMVTINPANTRSQRILHEFKQREEKHQCS